MIEIPIKKDRNDNNNIKEKSDLNKKNIEEKKN